MITCPSCQMSIQAGAAFCGGCGFRFQQAPAPQAYQQPAYTPPPAQGYGQPPAYGHAPPAMAPAPMQPMQPMHAPAVAPASGGKSKTGLIVGIVAGVLVVGGGVTAAVILTGGSDDKQEEASAKATEEEGDEAKDEAEPKAEEKEAPVVERKEEVAAATDTDKPASGFTPLGGLAELEQKLKTMGTDSAAGAPDLADPVSDIEAISERACACKDAGCADGITVELEGWMKKHGGAEPDEAEIATVNAENEKIEACLATARQNPAPVAAPATAAAPVKTGIPECDDYALALEEYLGCDQIPKETRDSTREAMKDAWTSFSQIPESYRAEVGASCKQGADAIRDATKMIGCTTTGGTTTTTTTTTQPVTGSGGSTGLPGCDRYIAATEALLACDAFPASSKDGLRQAMDMMKSQAGNFGMLPADSRKQVDDGCAQGADALVQSAQMLGCKL